MLCQKFKNENEIKIKTHCEIFKNISDREFWEGAKKDCLEYFENIRHLYDASKREHLTASLYRQFAVNGNRSNYEDIYFRRRKELILKVILECFYNDGSLMEDILDLTWMILEETSWTIPAHNSFVDASDSLPDYHDNTLDLFLAETACTMAFVYKTVGNKLDEMSKVVTRRIKERLEHDIIDDYLNRDDYWWMGFCGGLVNNWNPWINSNVLTVAITMEDDEDKLRNLVYKVMRTLDNYYDSYPFDGSCDEGPSYWNQAGLSFMECLWLLNTVSEGEIDFYKEEKVKNTFEYITKVSSAPGECINFADSGTKVRNIFQTIYKMALNTNNDNMKAFARNGYEIFKDEIKSEPDFMSSQSLRLMDIIMYLKEIKNLPDSEFDCEKDYYFKSTGVLISKKSSDPTDGLLLAVKGGHNDESHNHNDIGNFIVYKNGTKFIVDSGNMRYSKITFSPDRYTLWTTCSKYHNVPLIDGVQQKEGREYKATDYSFEKNEDKVTYSMNIKNAYPNGDEISKWIRTVKYDKKEQNISVCEDFEFKETKDYELAFLTPCKPEINGAVLTLNADNGENVKIEFEKDSADFDVEKIEFNDPNLLRSWKNGILYRVSFKDAKKSDTIKYKIY